MSTMEHTKSSHDNRMYVGTNSVIISRFKDNNICDQKQLQQQQIWMVGTTWGYAISACFDPGMENIKT